MTKKEAISIISKCAGLYASNLCDRQLAFVYRDAKNNSGFIEAVFQANNFMHFTGIELKSRTKANEFYRNAIDKRLKETDILSKSDHTTELKLQILHNIMNIAYSARMIGDYTGSHLELYTEKITGTTTACLGRIRSNGGYIPNTILKEDIRNITSKPPGKIFAIFRKHIAESQYNEITFQSKKATITMKCIPAELNPKISSSVFEYELP